jgi:hypothetical protein
MFALHCTYLLEIIQAFAIWKGASVQLLNFERLVIRHRKECIYYIDYSETFKPCISMRSTREYMRMCLEQVANIYLTWPRFQVVPQLAVIESCDEPSNN